jgi:hypothetical protein
MQRLQRNRRFYWPLAVAALLALSTLKALGADEITNTKVAQSTPPPPNQAGQPRPAAPVPAPPPFVPSEEISAGKPVSFPTDI